MAIKASVVTTPAGDSTETGVVYAEFVPVASVPYEVVVANVTAPIISTDTTYVAAAAEANYEHAVLGFAYNSLHAGVSYEHAVADVFIDDTGLYQIRFDIATLEDTHTFAIDKVVSDQFLATEAISLSFTTGFSDTTSYTDQAALLFSTTPADSLLLTDVFDKVFTKGLIDPAPTTDNITNTFIDKLLFDNAVMEDLLGVPDGVTYQFCKATSNTYSVSDQLTLDFAPVFVEQQPTLDSSTLLTDKVLQNTITNTDALIFDVAVNFSDEQSVVESLSSSVSKPLVDELFVDDVNTLYTTKTKLDSVSFTTSGAVLMQGYSSELYFSEDYVGTSRQF